MKPTWKHSKALLIAGVAALVVVTAAAASLITREATEPQQAAVTQKTIKAKNEALPWKQKQQAAAPQQTASVQRRCDDGNVVGTVVGGVGGGLVGSQIGGGSGKTAATIGGVLGGAYLGNQYIPTRGALCK